MAIERRRLLMAALPLAIPAKAHAGAAWAASWVDPQGQAWAGRFAGERELARLALPSRAHGLCRGRDGSLLLAARRPGDWLLRWQGRSARWFWQEDAAWQFNGHLAVREGRLYATETEVHDDRTGIAVHDLRSLRREARWVLPGHDAHALLALPDGGWMVAVGGLRRAGRSALPEPMQAWLVALDRSGAERRRWALDDPWLSPRHLACAPDGTVALALQAQHPEPAARAAAPLLALLDSTGLRTLALHQPSGYSGDLAWSGQGWWLSTPREHAWLELRPDGSLIRAHTLRDACAVVPQAQLVLGRYSQPVDNPMGRAWDNHALG